MPPCPHPRGGPFACDGATMKCPQCGTPHGSGVLPELDILRVLLFEGWPCMACGNILNDPSPGPSPLIQEHAPGSEGAS